MAREPIPPPGRTLAFDEWCRVLTAELRRYLPGVAAAMQGIDRCVWLHGGQEVVGTNEDGTYKVRLDPRFGGLTDMDRHDEYTGRNCGKTIAGHFDARFSTPDKHA